MDGSVEGFAVPVHRALTEPILLGGAPRAVAILTAPWPQRSASACGYGLPVFWSGRLAMPLPSGQRSAIRCLSKSQGGICVSPPI